MAPSTLSFSTKELAGSEETQDAILNLIESESMGPVFRYQLNHLTYQHAKSNYWHPRSVFEQGREQEFDRALAVFIRAKKREIESICNFHYQATCLLPPSRLAAVYA